MIKSRAHEEDELQEQWRMEEELDDEHQVHG